MRLIKGLKETWTKHLLSPMQKTLALCAILSFIGASCFLLSSAYIPAKALLAQYLLQSAWDKSISSGQSFPPWPWADTYPIAKLEIPALKLNTIVLAGASGRSLAFGPGHISSSPLPGKPGNSLISAHRDTHFENLDKLKPNDVIYLSNQQGERIQYKVVFSQVINTQTTQINMQAYKPSLGLITCYPLNGVSSDPNKRFFIQAQLESKTKA